MSENDLRIETKCLGKGDGLKGHASKFARAEMSNTTTDCIYINLWQAVLTTVVKYKTVVICQNNSGMCQSLLFRSAYLDSCSLVIFYHVTTPFPLVAVAMHHG